MLSRVNLVVILLSLNCISRAIEHSKSALEKWQEEERAVTSGKKVLRYTYDNVTFENPLSPVNGRDARDKVAKIHRSVDQDIFNAHSKSEVEGRGKSKAASYNV